MEGVFKGTNLGFDFPVAVNRAFLLRRPPAVLGALGALLAVVLGALGGLFVVLVWPNCFVEDFAGVFV